MKKHQLAIAVGALFLSAQAGIAALQQDEIAWAEVEVDRQVALQAGDQVAKNEQAKPNEQSSSNDRAAGADPVTADKPAPFYAALITAARITQSDVFPDGQEEPASQILPAQLAYLDEIERQRAASGQAIAGNDVFPGGQDEPASRILPAQLAYLDEIERQRAAPDQRIAQSGAAPTADEVSARSLWSSFVAFLKSLFGTDGSA